MGHAATITVAGLIYEHVTDLHALAPDDRLRQSHSNHTTSHLTVLAPYGRHGRDTGVLVRVVNDGPGWNSVLTDLSAEADPVYRATKYVEEARRDWGIFAVTAQLLCGAENRQAAEDFVEDRLHLTVVSRVPGGDWEPLNKTEPPMDLNALSDKELAALQFEAARILAHRQGPQL